MHSTASNVSMERWATGTAVMVDDVGSRDLDDAIWASETAGGGWTAVVHIAATAAVVEPGSPQDLRARKRVESKYLRDRTIPMLGQDVEHEGRGLRRRSVVEAERELERHQSFSAARMAARQPARITAVRAP